VHPAEYLLHQGATARTIMSRCCAGDEFHLVHIIKDETEKLRAYYQEKSLGAFNAPPLRMCSTYSLHSIPRINMAWAGVMPCSPPHPNVSAAYHTFTEQKAL